MTIWRRINDQGGEVPYATNGWVKIKNIWRRINDSGGEVSAAVNGWVKLRTIWRYEGSGIWRRIFGAVFPYPKSDVALVFISPNSQTSEYSCTQQDKMYVVRGKWYENPKSFLIKIQKAAMSSWGSAIDFVSQELEYSEYRDSDYLDQVPTSASNRPTITLDDIKNKNGFRAKIQAAEDRDPSESDNL
jgi:hypothetical protein